MKLLRQTKRHKAENLICMYSTKNMQHKYCLLKSFDAIPYLYGYANH